jgi:hypothetical protein
VSGKEAPGIRSSVSSIERDGGSFVGCVKTYAISCSGGSMIGGTGLFWLSRLMGRT